MLTKTWLITPVLLVLLGMNVSATALVLRDELSESGQRMAQLALVWLLPVIGALIVFAVHRPAEKHSGKYKNVPDSGEDDLRAFQIGRRRAGADSDDD